MSILARWLYSCPSSYLVMTLVCILLQQLEVWWQRLFVSIRLSVWQSNISALCWTVYPRYVYVVSKTMLKMTYVLTWLIPALPLLTLVGAENNEILTMVNIDVMYCLKIYWSSCLGPMYTVLLCKGLVMSTALFFSVLETWQNAWEATVYILLILPQYPVRQWQLNLIIIRPLLICLIEPHTRIFSLPLVEAGTRHLLLGWNSFNFPGVRCKMRSNAWEGSLACLSAIKPRTMTLLVFKP